VWRLVISFSVQNPEKDKSAEDKFNHISGSMCRLIKKIPTEVRIRNHTTYKKLGNQSRIRE
jgi:hypothetical protein